MIFIWSIQFCRKDPDVIPACVLRHCMGSFSKPQLKLVSLSLENFSFIAETHILCYKDFSGKSTNLSFILMSKAIWFRESFLLAHKLNLLGFSPKLLSWIANYLNDRTQRAIFKNNSSNLDYGAFCIRQGSHLGPLILRFFINNLTIDIRKSRTRMILSFASI